MNRRDFLTASGLLAIAGVSSSVLGGCSPLSGSDAAAKGVKQSYDTQVLVVGGGPAGVCAAIAAARQGVRTMLIEQGGALGGMATLGLVAPFMTCYDTKGEQMIIRGLFEEVVDRMVALGGAIHPSKVRLGSPYTAWITTGHDHCTPIDAEIMKLVLDQMCAEAGVKVLLHATLVNPVMRKNRVKGAVVLTRSGLEAIKADIVVDCPTGRKVIDDAEWAVKRAEYSRQLNTLLQQEAYWNTKLLTLISLSEEERGRELWTDTQGLAPKKN